MTSMFEHLKLLKERNRADWLSLVGIIPFLASLYFVHTNEPELALLAGIVAFVFDSLDGVVARKYGLESDFGRQIDSFMDSLIYLVFPSYFILIFLNPLSLLTGIAAVLVIGFGILRLIRFNIVGFVYKNGARSYPGLGTAYIFPAVIVLYIGNYYLGSVFSWLTPFVLITMSFAMVSEIPIKKPRLSFWYPVAIIFILTLLFIRFR